MILVLQRVLSASVTINGGNMRKIDRGLSLLVGICPEDDEKTADFMAQKTAGLRIFEDENGNMNLSLLDISGECLTVSNFTLYANCKKGKRPSFVNASPPAHSKPLYEYFVGALRQAGIKNVEDGEFGADMLVSIQNDGPVTLVLDSEELMPKN